MPEFSKELERREAEMKAKRDQDLEMIRMQNEKNYADAMVKKDAEILSRE